MKSDDLRKKAQLLCGLTINDVTAFNWVKDAALVILREHPLACAKKMVSVETENDGESYMIEDELSRLEKITEAHTRLPLAPQYYECDESGEIIFWHKGSYDIYYRYVPPMPTNKEFDIPLSESYADAIKYYLAARIRGRIYGQGDNDAQAYDALFLQYVAEADSAESRKNKRFRRMPARY